MVAYWDTSLLAGLYLLETRSAEVRELVRTIRTPIILTPLQWHELRNTLRLAVYRRRITRAEASALLATLENHVKAGTYEFLSPRWADVYSHAEQISAKHTADSGNRALDILHVASALAVGAREFYTFDLDQAVLARASGMRVRPA